MNLSTIVANVLRKLRGETAAGTICRKQNRIAAVAARETESINAVVGAEIRTVRTFVAMSLKKIDDLTGTGALDAETTKAVVKLRTYLGSAQAAL